MGSPGHPAHSSRAAAFHAAAFRGRDRGDVQSAGSKSRRWNPAELRLRIHRVSGGYPGGLVQVGVELQFGVDEGTWWVLRPLHLFSRKVSFSFGRLNAEWNEKRLCFLLGKQAISICRGVVYVHTYKCIKVQKSFLLVRYVHPKVEFVYV